MKKFNLILFLLINQLIIQGQSTFESPIGITMSFDKTWKKLAREKLAEKLQLVKDFLNYKKGITFEACYQKIGNADMDYPIILFKNIYFTATTDSEIESVIKYFTSTNEINTKINTVLNDKVIVDLTVGENYYDKKNNILVFTYDMGVSIKGNLVLMIAINFGSKGSVLSYCYSYKDEFKYDKNEFLEVIYSSKDKGMQNSMEDYISKHQVAVTYYNEARTLSEAGKKIEAIENYTKAIENYPIEDNQLKAEAYFNRGLNKRYLNRYKEAISDYTEAIKLKPDYYKAYNNRGYAKLQIEDYNGAISDFTLTIKFDNYNSEFTNMALGNRGIAKLALDQDGCADLKKAIELGNKSVKEIHNEYCK